MRIVDEENIEEVKKAIFEAYEKIQFALDEFNYIKPMFETLEEQMKFEVFMEHRDKFTAAQFEEMINENL